MNKSIFLGAVCLIAPFFLIPEVRLDIRTSKEYFFIFSCICAFWFFRTEAYYPLALSVLAFFNLPVYQSFHVFYQWILFSCGMYLTSVSVNIDAKLIKKFLLITALIESVWLILEHFGVNLNLVIYQIFSNLPIKRVVVKGFIDNGQSLGSLAQNTLSAVIPACLSPLFLYKNYWIFLPIIIYSVYLSKSAMCALTLLASVGVYLSLKNKIFLYISPIFTALFGTIVYYYNPDFFYAGMRVELWTKLLNNVGFTVFGKGLGYLYTFNFMKNAAGQTFRHAHCELLDLYISFGIVGLAFAAYFLSKIKITDKMIFAVFCGLIVNSMANLTFHVAPLALIGIISYLILRRKNEQSTS